MFVLKHTPYVTFNFVYDSPQNNFIVNTACFACFNNLGSELSDSKADRWELGGNEKFVQ